jgi:hypothetical protein
MPGSGRTGSDRREGGAPRSTGTDRDIPPDAAASSSRPRPPWFAQFDAGDIDEFDLDSLIHHYERSAAELWKYCGSTGGQWLQAARTLSYLGERGEEPDWWNVGAPRRDGSS